MIGCDCGTWCSDGVEKVTVVTCPQCLPAGAITWLIEKGRQLDLFEGPPEPIPVPGVLAFTERGDPDEIIPVKPIVGLDDGLPF